MGVKKRDIPICAECDIGKLITRIEGFWSLLRSWLRPRRGRADVKRYARVGATATEAILFEASQHGYQ